MLHGGLLHFYGEQQGRYSAELLAGIDSALRLKALDRPQSIAAWRSDFGTILYSGPSSAVASPITQVSAPSSVQEVSLKARVSGAVEHPRSNLGRIARRGALLLTAMLVAAFIAFSWRTEQPPSVKPAIEAIESAPATPEQAEAALSLTPYDIERLQIALTLLGFSIDSIDGVLTADTRAMIAAWQSSAGFNPNGYVNKKERDALLLQSAEGLAKYDEDQRRGKGDRTPK